MTNIERELERAFNLLMRASGLLVVQMVKRRFRRKDACRALALCQDAVPILSRLIASAEQGK